MFWMAAPRPAARAQEGGIGPDVIEIARAVRGGTLADVRPTATDPRW